MSSMAFKRGDQVCYMPSAPQIQGPSVPEVKVWARDNVVTLEFICERQQHIYYGCRQRRDTREGKEVWIVKVRNFYHCEVLNVKSGKITLRDKKTGKRCSAMSDENTLFLVPPHSTEPPEQPGTIENSTEVTAAKEANNSAQNMAGYIASACQEQEVQGTVPIAALSAGTGCELETGLPVGEAIAVAIKALQAIAQGASDAQQVAKVALDAMKLQQPASLRFPVPLARSISTSSCPEQAAPRGLVRTVSQNVDRDRVGSSGSIALARTLTPLHLAEDSDIQQANTFDVDVFSVEDVCTKSITALRHEETLASLVEKIKDEFAVDGTDEVKLVFGDNELGEKDLLKSLNALGINSGVHLSFKLETSLPFSVTVVHISGKSITVDNLMPDMNLASLINAVEQEMGVTGEECIQLILGTEAFQHTDLSKTLKKLCIVDGVELTSLTQIRPKGACPTCSRETSVARDVMIGATHEGWGLRWNTCNYSCTHCGKKIQSGESVNACSTCRCFWHRSCKLAGKPSHEITQA